jgi:hypothetical protein
MTKFIQLREQFESLAQAVRYEHARARAVEQALRDERLRM